MATAVKPDVAPHSLEAEKAVLGAVLVSGDAWPHAAAALHVKDFFRVGHQHVFSAFGALAARGVAIDYLTVASELSQRGKLEEAGGAGYLSGLTDGVPRSTNVRYYADIVREAARRRAVIEAAAWTGQAAHAGELSAAQVCEEAIRRLQVAARPDNGGLTDVAIALAAYEARLDEAASAPLATGYVDVDAVLGGGLQRGALTIVAARPSVGKTTWALGVADALARGGHRVLFFTLEMPARQLAGRLLAWEAGVSQPALERGSLDADGWARVAEAREAVRQLPLALDEGSRTVTEMRARCEQARAAAPVACVIVDYLQLLFAGSGRHQSRQEEVAAISRSLKDLAVEADVALLAVSQLSRAPEGRKDKRPMLSDLRDSGALEQDADVAVLLFRDERRASRDEPALTEAIVAKNRPTGETGVTKLLYDRRCGRLRNYAEEVG